MWLEYTGVVSGCCCKEVYIFPHNITYLYSTCICSLFCSSIPKSLFIFYISIGLGCRITYVCSHCGTTFLSPTNHKPHWCLFGPAHYPNSCRLKRMHSLHHTSFMVKAMSIPISHRVTDQNLRYAPKKLPLLFNGSEQNGSFYSRSKIFCYPFTVHF